MLTRSLTEALIVAALLCFAGQARAQTVDATQLLQKTPAIACKDMTANASHQVTCSFTVQNTPAGSTTVAVSIAIAPATPPATSRASARQCGSMAFQGCRSRL